MNKLNSGDLNTLQVGQVLLTKAFKTNTDKIQLEFAEKIAAKDKPVSALTVLNASDDRFSSGAARSWVVAEIEDAAKIFNVNFGDDGDWQMDTKANGNPCETITLNILNPEFNGNRFRVRVEETTKPTASQVKYAEEKGLDVVEWACKRYGKGGDPILHKGQHIFRNSYTDLLPKDADPVHVFLKSDTQTTNTTPNVGVKADEVEIENMY
tara:strand:+ start:1296 stop:1925 length:630 start_codon:yes stop_codon:yes gene_type:complete